MDGIAGRTVTDFFQVVIFPLILPFVTELLDSLEMELSITKKLVTMVIKSLEKAVEDTERLKLGIHVVVNHQFAINVETGGENLQKVAMTEI